MPAKGITRETLTEALARFEDVLAFHYPTMLWPLIPEGTHPRIVSQMADVLIDGLPVIGTPPNGWAL